MGVCGDCLFVFVCVCLCLFVAQVFRCLYFLNTPLAPPLKRRIQKCCNCNVQPPPVKMMFVGAGRRSGTRGGRDRFDWDDVIADKYRECYIGQSLAVQPNWWYDKRFQATGGKPTEKAEETKLPKGTAGSAIENTQTKEELDLIKQHEKALMAEALGLAPPKDHRPRKELKSHELKEIFKRGQDERDEVLDIERVSGLGASSVYTHEVSAKIMKATVGSLELQEAATRLQAQEAPSSGRSERKDDSKKRHKHKHRHKHKDKKHKHKHKHKKHSKKRKKRDHSRSPSPDHNRTKSRRRHDSDDEEPRERYSRRRHDSEDEESCTSRRRFDSDNERKVHHSRRRYDSGHEHSRSSRQTGNRSRQRHD